MEQKNNIEIDYDYIKPDDYILDNKEKIACMLIPTDGIRITSLISAADSNDMYFDFRTYSTVSEELANKFPYTDCIKIPFYNEKDLYDIFLDDMNLADAKRELHLQCDFEKAFFEFIDYNHNLYDEYFDFKNRHYKSIVIDWCKKNHIEYIDNT